MNLSALPYLAFKFYSMSLIGKLAYTVLVLNCFEDSVLRFTMDCESKKMQIVTPRFFIFLWSLGTIISGCLR